MLVECATCSKVNSAQTEDEDELRPLGGECICGNDEFGNADDLTDVYQLGAVFYELFTGQPPFEGRTTKVMRAVLNEDPTPPGVLADISSRLDEVLLTALQKEKTQRYETVIHLRDELQALR